MFDITSKTLDRCIFYIELANRKDAEEYQNKKRRILPLAYCDRKLKRAAMSKISDHTNVPSADIETDNDSKIAVQKEIQRIMNNMDGLFIELDADEVDAVQDILEIDEDPIVFIGMPFPMPLDSKIDFDTIEMNSATNEYESAIPNNNVCHQQSENIESAITELHQETPLPSQYQDNSIQSQLWQAQMGSFDFFQKSTVVPLLDGNNIASYLDIIHYHFEGHCIIVSNFYLIM